MRTKRIGSILFLLLKTGFLSLILSQPAKITTDKDNYIPGEWVIITGSGWLNDDSVQLTLKHPDPLPVPLHSHLPWFVKPDAGGMIYYEWYVLEQESETSFELEAVGFAQGIPASDYAVTFFRDGAITGVTVNGTTFCSGQSVTVSYTISNTGGQFGTNNIFTAQLSDSLGGFTSPVNIGTVRSRRSGNINAVIPSGTAEGKHYRIRLTSSNPVLTSNPNASDLTIHGLPSLPVTVTATPDTICAGSSVKLNATSAANSIRWYTSNTGGSPLGTSASGADFAVSPSVTTSYYAEALNTWGCSSSSRTRVTVTVIPIPTITGTTPGSVCGSGQVTLSATSSAGSHINWYSAGTGGEILGTGLNFTTPVITLTTTYYAEATAYSCSSGTRSPVTATVNSVPSAPVRGNITQPTCASPTGTVVLSGLPVPGTWTLTRSPGGKTTSGTGTTVTITGLDPGIYSYTVTNASGCMSASSVNITINTPTGSPATPTIGTITQPNCGVSTGSVILNGLPATGGWTITRTPGGVVATGTGITATITGIGPGSYTFTVTNAAGCTSASSSIVTINPQPASPATPIHTVDCSLGFGHAIITVTSPIGTGLEYSLNGGNYQTSPVFSGVANGSFFLTTRNVYGCTALGTIFDVLCGCVNPPAVVMGTLSGSTCGRNAITVAGNTFGGNATSVTITEDGAGSVSPSFSNISPFSFTYTPAAADAGRSVLITVTSNNPLGPPCSVATGTYILTVNAVPLAPVIGTVTSLTCSGELGSVLLNGLPSSGTWTLNRSPDNVSESGTGTTATITGLPARTYTFSVTSEAGCTSPSSADVMIHPQPPAPAAPSIGTVTQPTCVISTGTIVLNGLPATGTWTITQFPGGGSRTGTGISTTIPIMPSGTYTFTVTNSSGCTSGQSQTVVINPQPPTPAPPHAATVTAPTCTLGTGSVSLSGLPSTGTWTLTRYPGTISTTGTGTNITIANLPTGTYNFIVTNAAGCISSPSTDIIIPAQPPTPEVPIVGTITQPTLFIQTGSVTLSRLPSSGTWILTRLPDLVKVTGTGTSFTVTGIKDGKYKFTVTNSSGCTSGPSAEVIISTPVSPVLVINDPEPVCTPATVDITSPEITEGSPPGLTYTYWTDDNATLPYNTPATASAGTYYIKGTALSGFYDIKPVVVTVEQKPVSNPGPDQILEYKFSTTLDAILDVNESGIWRADSGNVSFSDVNDPHTDVSDLSEGRNVLEWIVSTAICPSDTGKITVTVRGLVVPTLITPNGDSWNEYFVLNGLETLGKTDLIIFDRRGRELFRNTDYDNKWNGVDYNGNPLPDDTYFFVLKSANGKSLSGYIMIRR